MSEEVGKAPSATDEGPDPHTTAAIHTSEAYRLAKRNTLFWSGTTILIALGTAASEQAVGTSLFSNLLFNPKLLTVLSLALLLLTSVGYVRAENRVVAQNSELMAGLAVKDYKDALEALGREVQEIIESYAKLKPRQEQIRSQIAKFSAEGIMGVTDDIANRKEQSFSDLAIQFHNNKTIRGVYLSDTFEEFEPEDDPLTRLDGEFKAFAAQIIYLVTRDFMKKFQTGLNVEKPDPGLLVRAEELGNELDRSAKSISQFAGSIGPTEQTWFKWYDKALVRWSIGIALVFAVLRIFVPSVVSIPVEYLFPRIEKAATSSAAPATEDTAVNPGIDPAQSSNPGTGASGSTEPTP